MPSLINKVKIFSGSSSRSVAEKIAYSYGLPLGDVSVPSYSDGEFQPSIDESVRGCDVFFIQSTNPPADNLLELLLFIDAAKRASAHMVTAVIPYFGLARQDRKDKPRVPIGAKMVANILHAAGADRVMTMDLHAPQIQGFFDIPVDHLDSLVIFIPYIKSLDLDNIILAAPDVGATKRVREFAKVLSCDMVICDKERKRANEVASMVVIGDVKGKTCLIVDDIIDSGGTIVNAAKALKDRGAKDVYVYITHGVLSGEAVKKIKESVIKNLVITDTIDNSSKINGVKNIEVLPISGLMGEAIKRISNSTSVSDLFK